MLKRKDLIMKKPEELSDILSNYSKDKKGEIADLTYAAATTIKVLKDRNDKKNEKLYRLDSELDEVKEKMCDSFCKYPEQCFDDDDLTDKCDKCPLANLKIEI